jgi:hypothetical protein
MASNEQQKKWALTLASELRRNGCGVLADALASSVLSHSPTPIIDASKPADVANSLSAIFFTLNTIFHAKNSELIATISRCDDLEVQAGNLQTNITNLQGELHAANKALQRAVTNIGGGKPKIQNPEPFSGEEKDTVKRHTEYTTWRSKIKMRHAVDAAQFANEFEKILHVAQLLEGDAYLAIQGHVDVIMNNPNNPVAWQWKTATKLLEALDRQYDNLDLIAQAGRELKELSQKDTPFPDFLTRFTILADRCRYTDALKVQDIRAKVNGKMKKSLISQYPLPGSEDWPGWVQLLRGLAENIANDEHQRRMNNPATHTPHTTGTGHNPDAMDLDRIHLAKISPEEMAYRIANNLCKRCGQPGHYAVNCDGRGNVINRGWGRGRGQPSNRGNRGQRGGRGNRGDALVPYPSLGRYAANPVSDHTQLDTNQYLHPAPYWTATTPNGSPRTGSPQPYPYQPRQATTRYNRAITFPQGFVTPEPSETTSTAPCNTPASSVYDGHYTTHGNDHVYEEQGKAELLD